MTMNRIQPHSTLENLKRAISGAIQVQFADHPKLKVEQSAAFHDDIARQRGRLIEVAILNGRATPAPAGVAMASAGYLGLTVTIAANVLNWQNKPVVRGNDTVYTDTLLTFISDFMAWLQYNKFRQNGWVPISQMPLSIHPRMSDSYCTQCQIVNWSARLLHGNKT